MKYLSGNKTNLSLSQLILLKYIFFNVVKHIGNPNVLPVDAPDELRTRGIRLNQLIENVVILLAQRASWNGTRLATIATRFTYNKKKSQVQVKLGF